MKKNKILININDKSQIYEYEKLGLTNFLFALEDYSMGYKTFPLSDIPDGSYLFMNRILDTKAVNFLSEHKTDFMRFKGIIFEDIAILNIFKDTSLELIAYPNHFNTNHMSMNFFMNHGCTSAVLSSEITENEINSIISNTIKPVVLNVFCKNQIMYSRRKLISNFNTTFNLEKRNEAHLYEGISKSNFLIKENDYGTVLFNNEYFNYMDFASKLDESKIKFFLVLNLDKDTNELSLILKGKQVGNDGFLNKKSVVKMKDYD